MPEKPVYKKSDNLQNEQHYRITLDDVISQYKVKLISATALMYYYIRIKRASGWKITLYQQQVCEELQIKKSAFYKAIAKLIEKGLIDTVNSNGITVVVNSPQFAENSPQNAESIPQFAENEALKQPHSKKESDSPNSLTDSYQIFIKSLSLGEKENFEKFCKKKAEEFPKPPTLLKKWIKSNWEDLRDDWYKTTNKKPSTANSAWENHPLKDKWIEELNNLGSPVWFYAPGDKLDKEKHNFFKWLCDSGQWGKS